MNAHPDRRSAAIAVTAVLTVALAAAIAPGQEAPVNGMRPADLRAHAIVGARVVVEPGSVLDRATVVIDDGVIVAVGADALVPAGARVWPGEGLTVYAGLIEPAAFASAGELPASPGRHWNANVRAEASMAERAVATDALRKGLREAGFTAAALYPEEGMIRGSGTVISLAESADHVIVYRDRAAMAMSFGRSRGVVVGGYPGSRMGSIALIRQTLEDARWYAACLAVYDTHPDGNEPPEPVDALAALEDVVAGAQPVLFDVSDEIDALRAGRIAREMGLDLVILGCGTEFRRLGEVVGLGVPLVLPLRFPERPDVTSVAAAESASLRDLATWEQAPTNPRRLIAAGATVAFTTRGLDRPREVFEAVRKAIEHGLSEDDALAALTTIPAAILGIDHACGRIEPGKLANLVVTDGALFDKKTKIRDVWVGGRRHEIEAAPAPTLALDGTLRAGEREMRVELDTAKPAATFHLADGGTTKAKKVEVTRDRLAMVVEGRPFDVDGYVRLGGVIIDGAVSGTAAMPDGSIVAFAITPREPEAASEAAPLEVVPPGAAPAEGAAPEAAPAEAAPPDAIAGRWSLTIDVPQMGGRVTLTLLVEREADGSVGVDAEMMGDRVEGRDVTYDAEAGRLSATFVMPSGMAATLEATIAGGVMTGTVKSEMLDAAFEGEREEGPPGAPAGDEDEPDVGLPPEGLLVPLGENGRAGLPEAQDLLFENAVIWTSGPRGIIESGAMLVRGGRIEAIYDAPPAESPVPRVDLGGRHVTPGLIDCHSHTGIDGGVNEFAQTNTAEVRVGDVIDPDDIDWYRELAGGLTAANQLHGSANPIGGQNSVVKLKWGGSAEDLTIDDAIPGIKFALGENVKRSEGRYPNSRMGVETFIRDAFHAARSYAAAHEMYAKLPRTERDRTMPPRRDLELEALVEILNGERLVHCHSYRQDEILMLIRVAEEFGFTIGTFQHVLEGYKVAEAIAAHGAGASSFSDWWAYKVEVMDAIPYNGALMTDVGAVVSFNSDSNELARRMNTEAAKAVRYGGLAPAEALKLVTINPARQLRIDHRTGSLEPGKDADFVVWSGDPLSTYTRCEQTWIEGARYFDREEDLALRARDETERQRIMQKILALAHGAPGGDKDKKEFDAKGQPAGAIADRAFERWAEAEVRRGRDPHEIRPGECGCGAAHGGEEGR